LDEIKEKADFDTVTRRGRRFEEAFLEEE